MRKIFFSLALMLTATFASAQETLTETELAKRNITRAMALGEIRQRDVLRVFKREFIVSGCLGLTLGVIAFLVATGFYLMGTFPAGDGIYLRLCLTIAISVLILVIYGSLVGSMLPFLLRLCHVDPASASAPFVTTIVDVSSIIIYFTIAMMLLKGFLL